MHIFLYVVIEILNFVFEPFLLFLLLSLYFFTFKDLYLLAFFITKKSVLQLRWHCWKEFLFFHNFLLEPILIRIIFFFWERWRVFFYWKKLTCLFYNFLKFFVYRNYQQFESKFVFHLPFYSTCFFLWHTCFFFSHWLCILFHVKKFPLTSCKKTTTRYLVQNSQIFRQLGATEFFTAAWEKTTMARIV